MNFSSEFAYLDGLNINCDRTLFQIGIEKGDDDDAVKSVYNNLVIKSFQ